MKPTLKSKTLILSDQAPEPEDWGVNINKLEAYANQHGDLNTSSRKDMDSQLSRWVDNIRKHPEKLPVELRNRLKRIGFDFQVSADWDTAFYSLVDFYKKYGHTYIPADQKEYEYLFDWAVNQRHAKRLLTPVQIEKLNSLGFDWTVQNDDDARWEENYQQLVSFKKEHGHVKVPQDFKENKALGLWVSQQRRRKTQNILSEERTTRLNELGFLWKEDIEKMRHDAWEKRYDQLVAYQKKHGHMDRIQIRKDHYQLGLWVETQLTKQDKMLADRKQKLDEIGFEWEKGDIYEQRWEQMYQKLLVYKEQHGHCRVKQHEDFKLSVWINRNKRDKEQIGSEKRTKLEQVGIKWPHEYFIETWESNYQALKIFKETNGHLNVPRSDVKFYEWIQGQKNLKNEGRLSKKREDKLISLGFIWRGDVERYMLKEWDVMYEKFKLLKEKFGDAYHIELKKEPDLKEWVRLQIQSKKKLSAYKKQKLNAIHFLWLRRGLYHDELWAKMYKELLIFKSKHGHCDVPANYQENKRLASWVNGQRTKKLSEGKKNKLNEIGFSWAGEIEQERWLQRVKEYSDLKARNEHMSIRSQTPLHSWVYQQRKNFDKLPDEKKKVLLEIGVVKNGSD